MVESHNSQLIKSYFQFICEFLQDTFDVPNENRDSDIAAIVEEIEEINERLVSLDSRKYRVM